MRRPRRSTLLAVAAAGLACLVVASFAVGKSSTTQTSSAARRPALADARKRLRAFVPPPGSRRVSGRPKSLSSPFDRIGSPNYLDVHDFWVSSSSVAEVRAYLAEYAPRGARQGLSGDSGLHGKIYRWDYGYEWPDLPGV